MAFFRTINFSEPTPRIAGDGVLLRMPQIDRLQRVGGAARAKPRLSHAVGADLAGRRSQPWRLPPPHPPLRRGSRTDQGYAFLIFRSADVVLVGGLTLANIRRGVAQAGSLGYWMGEALRAQGHMTAAVRAVVPFAFTTLRLHRLEAACIPTNAGSIRLLENTGFVREGYARDYLASTALAGSPALWAVEGPPKALTKLPWAACRLGMATVRLI